MAKFKEREKAIALRKEKQMSYSQIKKILKVSKSTLSLWLRNYPLSEERIRELQKSEAVIEKIRNTKRKKREKRLEEIYKIQKKLILPLKKREFFLSGLFLYWGEGKKVQPTELSISNNDPSIIKFFIIWLAKSLTAPKERLKVHLHLYKDMDIKKEIRFWSEVLDIPVKQFNKPYIKKSSSVRINHKGGFGHGTCNVRYGNARLSEKIMMGIKAIADRYAKMRV